MRTLKYKLLLPTLFLTSCAAPWALAHSELPEYPPESHAPAGVMFDHLHAKGEWMLGYRYGRETYRDIYRGSSEAGTMELQMAGYTMKPVSMTMEMYMLDIMYAVSDDLTLMLMPQYMSMDMSMVMIGSGHGAGHSQHTGDRRHSTSGVGDTVIAGLFRLANTHNLRLHATLGLSAPTGSVKERGPNGNLTHYGMQLGSGTWDLLSSLTYTSGLERLSWGAQLSARLPLEEENDSGFAFGERYGATAWSAFRVADWLSISARLEYAKEGDINGHYEGPHNHSSPPDRQGNYGGNYSAYGLGVNLVGQRGLFAGTRLGLEWLSTLSADYNGYQLAREDGLNMSLSYAF
ncbi:hypothetical protein [Microbulbifer sp. TYP-18]|uniref:hypothetical protein n=1 Tax=Microbulbifer sp. TYP-18 TaxID=3230024 RepID=UPI0034C67159